MSSFLLQEYVSKKNKVGQQLTCIPRNNIHLSTYIVDGSGFLKDLLAPETGAPYIYPFEMTLEVFVTAESRMYLPREILCFIGTQIRSLDILQIRKS